MATYTYRQAADEGFNRLHALWDKNPFTGGTFWFAGNTLQVVVDYLAMTGQRDSHSFLCDSLAIFDSIVPDKDPKNWPKNSFSGFWLDDYGWWGVALTKAYACREALGLSVGLQARVRQLAINCWTGMHLGWQDTPAGPGLEIIGGIPNTTNNGVELAGKNCVTNELYWLLSLNLSRALDDPSYLDPSTDSAKWFLAAKNESRLLSKTGMVYERFDGLPFFDSSWTWLGDQGLFLHCCLAAASAPLKASDIAAAVRANCVDPKTGVLFEDLCKDPQYYLSYATGKGIFMRNLMLLNESFVWHEVYDELIKSNATAVWNNRLPDGNFRFYWGKEKPEPDPKSWGFDETAVKIVLQANGLSALTASLDRYSNEQIPQ